MEKLIDKKEILILSELRKNARQSLTEISRRTDIPVSTVFDKLLHLNKTIIRRNVSLFNFDKIGHLKVSFVIQQGKTDLKEFLLNNSNVNSAYRVNKSDNLFIECLFRNLYEVELFKEKLADMEVKSTQEHHITEEIKREDFLTNENHIRMILENKGKEEFS